MADDPHESASERYGVRSVWAHLAMCAATAVLMTLAFPLPGWSFMAFFALVPVGVLAMRTRSLWTLAWTSYAVFFTWWALRVMWLHHVQIIAPLAIAVVCAGWFTLALVGLAMVQRRFRGAMTLTLPLFWCAQEILRSVAPLGGFAWFTLASSQAAWRADQHPGYLVQSADLFGWVTVSFLVAMTSGLLVDLIARPMVKRRTNGSVRPRRTIVAGVVIWLGAMVSAVVYGHLRLAEAPDPEQPETQSIALGVVQTNVPQSNKSAGEGVDLKQKRLGDFDRLMDLSRRSANDFPKPDLIIWPETVVVQPINDEMWNKVQLLLQQGLIEPESVKEMVDYRETITRHAEQDRVALMIGNSAYGFSSHDRSMNSALYVLPGKDAWQRYSKMHRVPLGEYIPGPKWFQGLVHEHFSPYEHDYTVQPGEGVVIFERQVDGVLVEDGTEGVAPPVTVRFATPICYEDAVAVQCRKMVYDRRGNKRADLLVNLTNDGWFPGPHQGYQHLQIAVLRCIENRVPMARSVNTGVSGVIDSSGRVGPLVVINSAHKDVEGYVNARVAIDPRSTLYGRLREGVWVGLCAVAGLMLLGVLVPGSQKRRAQAQAAPSPKADPKGKPSGDK